MLVNLAGGQEELTCFERDSNTDAEGSCSINWQNEFYIFGGGTQKRQISRLSGHKLERVGDLDFDLALGACNVKANELFLCFHYMDTRRCRRSTGPLDQFSEVALSTHEHRQIKISCSDSKFLFLSQ